MIFRRFLLFLVAAACFAGDAPEFVNLRFSVFSMDAADAPVCFVNGNGKIARLPVSNRGISPAVHYSGPPLMFLVDGDEDDGVPLEQRKVLARVRFPANSNYALVILAKAAAGAAIPWRAVVMNTPPTRAPESSVIICNFTGGEVAGLLETQKIRLGAGQMRILKMPEKMQSGGEGARIQMAHIKDGAPAMFYSSVWFGAPESREWVFIVPDANGGGAPVVLKTAQWMRQINAPLPAPVTIPAAKPATP